MTQIMVSSTPDGMNPCSSHPDEGFASCEPQIQAHPLGIRPSGNALTASSGHARDNIGTFDSLTDEVIMIVLEWLQDIDLLRLGSTCRAFFAFTSTDDLWKTLFLREERQRSPWGGSWRATYLELQSPQLPSIDCRLYSDALYRPFCCSQIDLSPFAFSIPSANRIPRLADLSQADFSTSWNDRPFILTQPVKKWPIFSKWCQEALLDRYGHVEFRAEVVDWPLRTYIEYMNHTIDESPLYLFDKDFVPKMNLSVSEKDGAYWPPECFGEDLFALLGEQRPDSRWLIIGPERSGSTFHKDPNATSAWNAVIRGSKYWIMFPGSTLPPGVFVSQDQSEVTSPLSIAEWLLTFHEEARHMDGCLEGICREGEVLHVPSGWWHLVVNLESAIAITQNFIPRSHLKAALDFLEKKPDQISGFSNHIKDPYQLFIDKLTLNRLEIIEQLHLIKGKKRKWEQLLEENGDDNKKGKGGFSFGFADDEAEEVP
jgi:Cupin-like domain/F-box domain